MPKTLPAVSAFKRLINRFKLTKITYKRHLIQTSFDCKIKKKTGQDRHMSYEIIKEFRHFCKYFQQFVFGQNNNMQ